MDASASYRNRGFFIAPEAVVSQEQITRVLPHCDLVAAGIYPTGVRPWRQWNVGHAVRMQKIDQAHLADDAIFDLVTHPAIGAYAARVTGARRIQLWATQLLTKPPGGGSQGHIGWHDDDQNWPFWQGEVFTIWLALTEIKPETGPMHFLPGSHEWRRDGDRGDAYRQDLKQQREGILNAIPDVQIETEVEAVMPLGGLSIHGRYTLHCSGPNHSSLPRRSIAINVCTEKASPTSNVEDYGFCAYLDNPRMCPILYES